MSPSPWHLRHVVRSLPVVLLLASASCAELFGVDEPDLSVSAYLAPPAAGPLTIVTRVDGARASLTVDATTRTRSRSLGGVRYGAVPASAVLRNSAGDTLAVVEFAHTLESGSTHWVGARVGALRPDGFCTGALVFAPVTGSSTDTLFVSYGSLPKDALC